MLEAATVYNQLQAEEVAALELVASSALLVELRPRDRGCGPCVGLFDEAAPLYTATRRARGLLCVCPV